MTPWKGDKVRVIQTCTTCHSDDGYSESVHGKSVIDGNPDSATCSDCHGLHKIPLLKGDEPKAVESGMNPKRWSSERSSTQKFARNVMQTKR
ncbi:MAG: nuclease [Deltaproteobacteria bacterium]|nr:nuclease [Deltaproteobacteria bacterium]